MYVCVCLANAIVSLLYIYIYIFHPHETSHEIDVVKKKGFTKKHQRGLQRKASPTVRGETRGTVLSVGPLDRDVQCPNHGVR